MMSISDRGEDERGETIVSLAQEHARIEKRSVATGRVVVRTEVETFQEIASAILEAETYDVTRVPVDQVVSEAPSMRTEGDITIVPVFEEVLFVEKRLVLKEELHIRRRRTEEAVSIPLTLKRQRAHVEHIDEQATERTKESS
jgi:uncharacterized protein (TIGR02271 family)